MTQSVCLNPATLNRTAGAPAASGLAGFGTLMELLLDWQRRARERQTLAGLSDTALRDVGLSRADIFEEAAKPFWRE